MLRHEGLGRRQVLLRPKLLTCGKDFAVKHHHLQRGLTQVCTTDKNQHQYVQRQGVLGLILGLNFCHIGPKVVDTFSDKHGYMSVLECPLAGRLIASGNRTLPLSKNNIDKAIKEHNSSFYIAMGDTPGENGEKHTTMSLFCSLQLSPPLPDLQVPVKLGRPNLRWRW